MDYCLWLNGKKVNAASEIIRNFDLASLRGYFLGGSLIKWLLSHGGEEYAERLNEISAVHDINSGIEYAFGITDEKKRINTENKKAGEFLPAICVFGQSSFHNGSFFNNSYNYSFNSFGSYGSYNRYKSFDSFGSYGSFFSSWFGTGPGGLTPISASFFKLNMYGYGIHLISEAVIKRDAEKGEKC